MRRKGKVGKTYKDRRDRDFPNKNENARRLGKKKREKKLTDYRNLSSDDILQDFVVEDEH